MEFYPGYQYLVTKAEVRKNSALSFQKAITVDGVFLRCRRCNTKFLKSENQLPDGRHYCRACMAFGRVTSNHYLGVLPLANPKKRTVDLIFCGQLTAAQKKISQGLVENFKQQRASLVYAVTGAGKTEMLFELLHYCLAKGLSVAFCSPRVDVCCEIQPRLQAVFPKLEIGLRHYGAKPYQPTSLLVCTTHQLLYFKAAFHLIVVDEIDAFPYAGDQRLHFAVNNALHKTGSCVFLSATPSETEIKVAQKTGGLFCLPARFHRRQLPLPKLIRIKTQKLPLSYRIKKKFLSQVMQLLQHNHLLLFCATVQQVLAMEKFLKMELGDVAVGSVHAADCERQTKVKRMRQNKFQIFCCSTVMERGVTFANVSVLVFGADHLIFTQATLLQIAGRADRKGDFSNSEVVFYFTQMTNAIRKTLQTTKNLNQQAKKAGLLNEM